MSNIKRLIKESLDLSSNESLMLLSYYHDLRLVETLLGVNYENKTLISNLMDHIEKIKPEISEIEDINRVKIFIKYLIVMFKNNIELSRQYLSSSSSLNPDDEKNNVIQSIWLNIDLLETFEQSFTDQYIQSNEELQELVNKLESQQKIKSLKMLLKKVLTFVPDFDQQDDELLQKQLESYDENQQSDEPQTNKNVSSNEEDAPDFESDEDVSKTNHDVNELNLPEIPESSTQECDEDLKLNDIALSRKTAIEKQEESDSSDYNTSEISEIVTSQETIDKMVKLAKIGIQCIQYEDFTVAKDNFENLIHILKEELKKIENQN
ncbi:uncharacterized protein HGUI_01759 [Hanseniaspora guilliermondii]|uniref:Uncharacterized protein n=1 Tax=Hanseniaspora guilliermondii TaxID=56406 RepID=A0A1L0CXK3_9ASCO|nr:uncharacterized protein HGUI_01759 [Hanseniaspora guilliermondii]